MKPLVVITVTYSPGQHLEKLIDSLSSAYSAGTRIILADNGSTDGVPELLASKYPNVELFRTGANLGYGAAVNAAVRHLRKENDGSFDEDKFMVVNPDVIFHKGSIDILSSCMDRYPEAGAVGPAIVEEDGSLYPSAREVPNLKNGIGHALVGLIWKNNPFSRAYHNENNMDQERKAGWLSGSCLLLRWEAFSKLGGFDERYFMYMEDVDLGDRLKRLGYTSIYCPEAKINHDQGHSATNFPALMSAAHHASAYRFQADRFNKKYHFPIRFLLYTGLQLRRRILVFLSNTK